MPLQGEETTHIALGSGCQEFAGAANGSDGETAFRLHDLPPDALKKILEICSLQDIARLCQASRQLYTALQDDRVWFGLCTATWGRQTDPRRWLVQPTSVVTPCSAILPAPTTFRGLYSLLHESAPIVDSLWRLVGEGPCGSLISFSWAADGILAAQLEAHSPLTGKVDAVLWARICPAHGLNATAWVEPERGNATLTVHGNHKLRIHRSPSAEAAAAVALPHSQARLSMLCNSPQGSFEAEWLEFMSMNVRGKGSRCQQRRRSQRSPGGPATTAAAAAVAAGPMVFHLKQVPLLSQPTQRHPLAGLWLADYELQGLEFLALHYDFRGKAATLCATKVTGDERLAAGQCSWHCTAAALPTPWSSDDQHLVQQHEERWLQERQWWDAAGEAEGTGSGGMAAPGTRPPQVVAIHPGSGQQAPGVQLLEWAAGRLLVFDDGRICFVWLAGELAGELGAQLIMQRVETPLPKPQLHNS